MRADHWQVNPDAEEIVSCVIGKIRLYLRPEEPGRREEEIRLTAGTAAIVPRGRWHRIQLDIPSTVMTITPPGGARLEINAPDRTLDMIASMPRSTRRYTPQAPCPRGFSGGREGILARRRGLPAGGWGLLARGRGFPAGGSRPGGGWIEAAAGLLAREGARRSPPARSRRRPGCSRPRSNRHFDDMDGLLDAVAEHGYARFLEAKQASPRP
ncbi:hypothetical protein GCM10020220_090520 [Nonomuraea rubra]|uniref:hypothetical protein n=1 Tax=Nonomuraea rubra TaxID=46180 RepID=UPI0031E7E7C9